LQLARAENVRPARAHERAGTEPLAAQHGIARRRDRNHDVLLGGIAVTLALLCAYALAELAERHFGAAVGDDALDSRNGCTDASNLDRKSTRLNSSHVKTSY